MSIGARPSIQEECQKDALHPSPMVTTVLILNNCRSIASQGTVVPTQGLSWSVHSNQSHRSLKALPNSSKSRTPRPPNFFGRMTFAQRTKQCPPFASAEPFHKNLLLILSILLIAHLLIANTVRKCTGMDVRTALSSFNLPALFRNFSFQVGSLAATFSTKGCTSTRGSLLKCSGSPK